MSGFGSAIFVAIVVVLLAAVIAFNIIMGAITVWSWQINPLWGIAVFVVWCIIGGGGAKVSKR